MPCDLNRSEDQRQILDAASAMLQATYPVSRRRTNLHDDLTEIGNFGAFSLALSQEQGGAGLSLVEEALIHVLFGRHLVSPQSIAIPLAVRLAANVGQHETAAEMAMGKVPVCPALPAGGSLLLADATGCDLALVFAEGHLGLLEISGISRVEEAGLGHGLAVQRIAADSGSMIGADNGGELLQIAHLLVSAQMLGIAEATRDIAVDYAGIRKQFGKPIGAFQAIKHHCANMAIAAEMGSAQLDMAAISLRAGRSDARFQVAALRHLAGSAAMNNARLCIQIHGAIGFSAEADAHHYVKQTHVLSLLGKPSSLLSMPSPLTPNELGQERN